MKKRRSDYIPIKDHQSEDNIDNDELEIFLNEVDKLKEQIKQIPKDVKLIHKQYERLTESVDSNERKDISETLTKLRKTVQNQADELKKRN